MKLAITWCHLITGGVSKSHLKFFWKSITTSPEKAAAAIPPDIDFLWPRMPRIPSHLPKKHNGLIVSVFCCVSDCARSGECPFVSAPGLCALLHLWHLNCLQQKRGAPRNERLPILLDTEFYKHMPHAWARGINFCGFLRLFLVFLQCAFNHCIKILLNSLSKKISKTAFGATSCSKTSVQLKIY